MKKIVILLILLCVFSTCSNQIEDYKKNNIPSPEEQEYQYLKSQGLIEDYEEHDEDYDDLNIEGEEDKETPKRIIKKNNASQKYFINGVITRDVLENYLSRSITMSGLLTDFDNQFEENAGMINNIGAKFLGRSILLWGNEHTFLNKTSEAKEKIKYLLRSFNPNSSKTQKGISTFSTSVVTISNIPA